MRLLALTVCFSETGIVSGATNWKIPKWPFLLGYQFHNVQVAVARQEIAQIRENGADCRVVDVVEKTVDEHKIEALAGWRNIFGRINSQETPASLGRAEAALRVTDILFIKIDP